MAKMAKPLDAEKLGYTKCWYDLGIVNNELIISQIQQFAVNPYGEHWRISSLKEYLSKSQSLELEQIQQIASCLASDKEVLQHLYLYVLDLDKYYLPDFGYGILSEHFRVLGTWAKEKSRLFTVKRKLSSGNYSLQDVEEWVIIGNRRLQEEVLKYNKSNPEVLQILADIGNKKVANQARKFL